MPVNIIDVHNGVGNRILCTGIVDRNEFIQKLGTHLSQDEDKFKQIYFNEDAEHSPLHINPMVVGRR